MSGNTPLLERDDDDIMSVSTDNIDLNTSMPILESQQSVSSIASQQQQQQSSFRPPTSMKRPGTLKKKKQGARKSLPSNKQSDLHKSTKSSKKQNPKKKQQYDVEVTFDESDLTKPLPVNYKCYALWPAHMKFYEIKILEVKKLDNTDELQEYIQEDNELFSKSNYNDTTDYTQHMHIYYIHYLQWDRRMDEWVSRSKIRLYSQIQALVGQRYTELQAQPQSNVKIEPNDEADTTKEDIEMKEGDTAVIKQEQIQSDGKNNQSISQDQDSLVVHATGNAGHGHGHFSEEDLRAHEEATKVKNIDSIQFGNYKMQTWYYSPFPVEYNKYRTLYFCEFCLSYFGLESELVRHSIQCTMHHPPGNEIYRSVEHNVTVAVFELDGQIEKVYCQNLCYIGKLYLDHKTLEYDCTPFLFYVICEYDKYGYHPVGYFSKEKHANSQFNLACILTLPAHQKKGYGKFIISLSYELSKVEGKIGSPEKPVSDLGQQAYSSYWSHVLVAELAKQDINSPLSIQELSERTSITTDDIIETLKLLKILQWYEGRWVYSHNQVHKLEQDRLNREIILKDKLTNDNNAMYVAPCRPEKLHYIAYVNNKKNNKNNIPVY